MTETPGYTIVLASASPRRRRLLALLGLDYETTATDTPEVLDPALVDDPQTLAANLAAEKAHAARAAGSVGLVLGFDTIVVHAGMLLGKPEDPDDARRMLHSLSGDTHDVVTGIALLEPGTACALTRAVTTPVRMHGLTDARIDEWFATGEYLGCAGAYNIESHLAEVDGDQCFQNVAGLPLCHLYTALFETGIARRLASAPHCPVGPCDTLRNTTCALGPRLVADVDGPPDRVR